MDKVVVIGAGISGLAFAYYLKKLIPNIELIILEKENRVGGKVWTMHEEGFIWEKGVNAVLASKLSMQELALELSLPLYFSSNYAKKRFIVKNGKLSLVPEKPQEFIKSNLLSPLGKIRLLIEFFIKKKDSNTDESIKDFCIRRIGKEAFERLIDPMVTGIFAGDPEKLSISSCFPKVAELEKKYGSLIKGMIHLQKEAKKRGEEGPSAAPKGTLVSFTNGMEEIISKLKEVLIQHIRLNSEVKKIINTNNRWFIYLQDNTTIETDTIVVSCPLNETKEMLKETISELDYIEKSIPYPPMTIVVFGLKASKLPNHIHGFGFLCPHVEKRKILGTLFDSFIFPNRAPKDYALLRTFIGGMRAPELAKLNDAELIDLTINELSSLFGIKISPDFIRICRWDKAIPQYHVGYEKTKEQLLQIQEKFNGLYFRCNYLGGVSFSECISNSKDLAERLASSRLKK